MRLDARRGLRWRRRLGLRWRGRLGLGLLLGLGLRLGRLGCRRCGRLLRLLLRADEAVRRLGDRTTDQPPERTATATT